MERKQHALPSAILLFTTLPSLDPSDTSARHFLLFHAYNDKVVWMIPPLTREGLLPPGIHWATWEEFASRFGGAPHRERLLAGLKAAIENLQQAGCGEVYIGGSFVTRKVKPQDFDACSSITFSAISAREGQKGLLVLDWINQRRMSNDSQ